MIDKNKIQEISDKISKIIEDSPISDIEENINALLQSTFTKLDLISREEFDVQTQVLKRTRLKLEDLDKKIDALQTKSKKQK